ncbi:ATP-grasp domain-containing protein [Ornithinibacillus contaminans]|uniref:ATP-grasp domain-containing protein n=1 Tax=Ornithinibacillus contaminans TaxID=694055 RepID=UPI00064D7428|nr:hypothetical protein [Ornithinibacillus contaminans]
MKYSGWLIYSKRDAHENQAYISWFIEEAAKQAIQLTLILREQLHVGIIHHKHSLLYEQKLTKLPDFAVIRTIEPLLSYQLEQLGINVFNNSSVAEICNHKGRTYFEVAKLGIPMVDTLFIKQENLPSTIPIPLPFVIKEVAGRGGKQVYYVECVEQWDAFIKQPTPGEYVIQSTDVQLGKDLRVFVVGNRIVGAVLRESNQDFRANYTLGGSAKLYELSHEEQQLIHKIIQHFDFGMVGIDFLIGHEGQLLFNEIEDVVGSRTLSAVSNVNILADYITHIVEKLERDS